ncbi:MAG: type II toxin-antitoxin system RelE family toxin [Pseudonocardia sp.]
MQGAARRAIGERLPEDVAAAMIEFLAGPLSTDPLPVGKPLSGPLAGCHGARRGTYRIIYRVDADARTVQVLDVDHRSSAYRRR